MFYYYSFILGISIKNYGGNNFKVKMTNETMQKEDNRTPSVISLERNLLKTSWVKESELIQKYVPEEDLTKAQQKLLQKCIDKEEFTDKQLADLKLILVKYRKILQKINPQDTVDNVEKSVKMIKTEADFINLMNNDEQKRLLVNIKTYNGVVGFDFIVLPISDSRG